MSELYPPGLKKYAQIHGHICFGLAMGYQAGRYAQGEFGISPLDGKENVVVLLESSECTQEGIQLVTSCTCQTGALVKEGESKYVFVFYHRALNQALRLSARAEIMAMYQPIAALKAKMRAKTASKEETDHFWELNRREVKHILELPVEEVFDIQSFEMALLVKLNPFEAIYVPKPGQASCGCSGTP